MPANTKDMKKKIIFGTVLSVILIPVITFTVLYTITNPKFDINGWADMDAALLGKYSETYTIFDDRGDEAFHISQSGAAIAGYEDLPKHTINAFIAAEDKRFFEHEGIDYYRIMGAAVSNIKNLSFKEGASTITQQLVKNTHLNSEKTIDRKLKEIRIAREIEQNYSKEEILTMYLNALYFGHNIYGITDAANYYFGKNVASVSISESALLAAIINNPSYFDPVNNPDNAMTRRNLILDRMYEQNFLTEEQNLAAKLEEINISDKRVFSQYQYFVMKEFQTIKDTQPKAKIFSEFDQTIQLRVEEALNSANISNVLASAIVLDVESGKVVASAANTTSDITSLNRQPGSIIKPIISYAPALEDNIITPITMLDDSPAAFGNYSPSNYNNKYYGWQTAENCLSYSLNIPAVRLLEMNGIKRSKQFARKLGLYISNEDNGLAIALGGLKNGVTLKQLADAYASFARGGKFTESKSIKGITEANMTVKQSSRSSFKVMHDDTAYFINKMLTSCAKSGTAKKLKNIENIAAKTGTVGTSEGNTDAYCVAYNKNYVVAAWIGAPSGVMPGSITGGGKPADICAQIMKNSALSSGEFTKPSSIVTLEIDLLEYENNRRLIIADKSLMLKDKMSAQFSLRNLPSHAQSNNYNSSNGNNFKIVDNFSD